jgi:glycosyltransferase involved in cell wall biosynthesis
MLRGSCSGDKEIEDAAGLQCHRNIIVIHPLRAIALGIFMRILFANAHYYLPQYVGGLQSSTHELALELKRRGHEVSVLANLIGNDLTGLRSRLARKLFRQEASVDHGLGYPIYRTWFAWDAAEYVMRKAMPDVVVIQPRQTVRLGLEFQRIGAPIVVYLRDVEFHDHGGSLSELTQARFIANSEFTARQHQAEFGIQSAVIHPLFHASRYRTQTSRRAVTFINPVGPKGVDTALEVVSRCPDIPFCFVEGWKLGKEARVELNSAISRLPNVRLRPNTNDMRTVYSEARIILMPSKWDEAWGRIASEAHFSGIPVVASNCGGLPESVGPGGILIDRDAPVESWVNAIKRLWDDSSYYDEISRRAYEYADRPAIRPEHQIDAFLQVLREAQAERRT